MKHITLNQASVLLSADDPKEDARAAIAERDRFAAEVAAAEEQAKAHGE